MSDPLTALDLFAGTGWGVACKRIGIREMGVDNMPEVIATRDANGMATIYRDVWDGLEGRFHVPNYQILIASPPCQTFSLAGKGSGRAALNEVLEAIELHTYKDPTQLREFGERHDPRTALVLAPLAHVWRDRPEYVAFEQVPTVLPVWEACAEVMREWGYSVDVAILNAEQYGVPQTRKRAILVGRLNGEAKLPTPTHSKYHSRTPEKLDPGVLPWVSMAEALGWADIAIRPEIEGWKWRDAPATTIAGDPRITAREHHYHGEQSKTSLRLTMDEAVALQTYPTTVFRNGNQAHAAKRPLDAPAPTIHFGARANKVEWMDAESAKDPAASGQRVTVEEASALQSYPTMLRSNYGSGGDPSKRGERRYDQPAPTLTSKADRNKWDGATSMSQDEAATLQTYEKPFEWVGTKTKTFLQIGNAVPPLLAQAVLSALTEAKA